MNNKQESNKEISSRFICKKIKIINLCKFMQLWHIFDISSFVRFFPPESETHYPFWRPGTAQGSRDEPRHQKSGNFPFVWYIGCESWGIANSPSCVSTGGKEDWRLCRRDSLGRNSLLSEDLEKKGQTKKEQKQMAKTGNKKRIDIDWYRNSRWHEIVWVGVTTARIKTSDDSDKESTKECSSNQT